MITGGYLIVSKKLSPVVQLALKLTALRALVRRSVTMLLPVVVCLCPTPARGGGGPQNVLVVIDQAVPDSVAIGEYYVQARDIPPVNVLRLNAPVLNSFNDVIDNLATPLKDYIAAEGLDDQIDFIVLTKGIPYKFSGLSDSVASILFSEETDTWTGGCYLGKTALRNPYFRKAEFFDYNTHYVNGGIPLKSRRLVMMLSGFTRAGAFNNIDSGVLADETAPDGTIYMFSARPSLNLPRLSPRHNQIPEVRAALACLGIASEHLVVTSEDDADLYDTPDVMGYLTGATRVEVLSNTYLPGAVADHMTSFGGDLLRAGGQMSILEFTDAGVAGSSGTVTEPCNYPNKFTDALLYERYAVGFSLAESIWMSLDQPWQTMVVGDPLSQPWAVKPTVTISAPADGVATSGLVSLEVTADHPRGDMLSRMDLFIDGKFAGTLMDLTAPAGNSITLRPNNRRIDYTTMGGEDSFDILNGLIDNARSTPGFELTIPAATTGRSAYLKVLATSAGPGGNGIPVSVTVDQGNGAELGVAARLDGPTLQGGMDSVPADEIAETRAQDHLFVSVGRAELVVDTVVDLSAWPDGPHELRVVAYQGDRVFTQGYAKRTVIKKTGPPGDFTGDGQVDLNDLATFAVCFAAPVTNPPPGCSPQDAAACDLDGNGMVDLNDFATFSTYF